MIQRLFVEKRPALRQEAQHLRDDLRSLLGLKGLEEVRLLLRYDVEGVPADKWEAIKWTVFAEPPVDDIHEDAAPLPEKAHVIAVEFLPGQFDQRAESAAQCIQIIAGHRPLIATATLYVLTGDLSADDLAAARRYLINPVDSREASLDRPETLESNIPAPRPVPVLAGFIGHDDKALEALRRDQGLAMTLDDLRHTQAYFREQEQRDPSLTELKLLDTYWSDHCRHTTFLTEITKAEFEESPLTKPIQQVWETYTTLRSSLYLERQADKPICLMDLATIGLKQLRQRGQLDDLEASEEINAASIIVPVKIRRNEPFPPPAPETCPTGSKAAEPAQATGTGHAKVEERVEEWLVMFKNETHNHPTEIEPFGGAATCLGGCIRDPLSGRAYVYQAMRVTGAADPRLPIGETLEGKLPQRRITQEAARGYSSYGNQIGLATGAVTEIYHPGYVAKRLEIGAVVGAAPRRQVRRERPAPGDIILLVGGRTGRDGIGGATGSSKEHNTQALENSAEVQKGDAPTERKLQRLFRRPRAAHMIKRCNDFGAGGVSVAIGELAPSLRINLDAVPKKYAGLDGTELAISESQERMAVVLAPEDVEAFAQLAAEENLEASQVAEVTDTGRLEMFWQGERIVNLDREFLDTNGCRQETTARVTAPQGEPTFRPALPEGLSLAERWQQVLQDLNVCSQKGLMERFDGSIGAGTVLFPFGGAHELTAPEAMAAKVPLAAGGIEPGEELDDVPVVEDTATATLMSHGYNPYLSSWSPFHGAVYAVLESVARIVAAGGQRDRVRLTLQEYFERLRESPERWGKPLAALLGALHAQLELETAAIGGKDSMSGSFHDLDVPPTLVSFALAPVDVERVISPEFKRAGSRVIRVQVPKNAAYLPDFEALRARYDRVSELIGAGQVLSAISVKAGGLIEAVTKMTLGNFVGFAFDAAIAEAELLQPDYGALLLEVTAGADLRDLPHTVLGETLEAAEIHAAGTVLPLAQLRSWWEEPLEKIFPVEAPAREGRPQEQRFAPRERHRPKTKVAKPRVFIPVFPGTNCEYDTARAFARAGAIPQVEIFRNLTDADVAGSLERIVRRLDQCQILVLPGGFSAGDEPAGSGKFIASVFRQAAVKDATHRLLHERDGLALGICNGFQAMVKLGLLPFGEIRDLQPGDPTLTYNWIGRHMSRYARTRVLSTKSPWLAHCRLGEEHMIPISHGEGCFEASTEALQTLWANDQVATQYIDAEGRATYDPRHNPNGSIHAIEGITSPCGRVLGKMGHSERVGPFVGVNVPGNHYQPLFEAGVQYFH
ncbi:MAG: phosphoribosylformylglycinamidine synthase [Verrucomicrobiota bacterium JB022]|nr:phosphoribosylformylglycinamidine synthase [Verrucomicrobiota bacterium JB022]